MCRHIKPHLLARDDPTDRELVQLLGQLDDLLERLGAAESTWSDWVVAVNPAYRASARNIVHYWAIRQADLCELQSRLAVFGLSSLGRSESHVEATLRVVRSAVAAILEDTWHPPAPAAVGAEEGRELLRCRTVDLLGPAPADRETRIMVTLPSEAAANPDLVRGLVQRGMNVARINCVHDEPTAWRAMAEHVRHASAVPGRSCLVAMDLAGPKLRTGPIQPGPRVVKLRPSRDALGHVSAPAHAWLTSAEDPARIARTGNVDIAGAGRVVAPQAVRRCPQPLRHPRGQAAPDADHAQRPRHGIRRNHGQDRLPGHRHHPVRGRRR